MKIGVHILIYSNLCQSAACVLFSCTRREWRCKKRHWKHHQRSSASRTLISRETDWNWKPFHIYDMQKSNDRVTSICVHVCLFVCVSVHNPYTKFKLVHSEEERFARNAILWLYCNILDRHILVFSIFSTISRVLLYVYVVLLPIRPTQTHSWRWI